MGIDKTVKVIVGVPSVAARIEFSATTGPAWELSYGNTLLGPLKPMEGNVILSTYLSRVKGAPEATGWETFASYSEHGEWVTKDLLLQLLGKKLNRYSVKRVPTDKESASSQALLWTEADYVAIVDTFNSFRNLVDRYRALDEVVRRDTTVK